jgi:type I restriction-modification system DNA methylase subunit
MQKKKSDETIKEKSSQMVEIGEVQEWGEIISKYLKEVSSQVSESAKSNYFLMLLTQLFGLRPAFIEEYISGIEKYVKVKQTDCILRGKIDNLFGNLVIEFERNLAPHQREAEEQLKKYIACLWSQEPPQKRTPYLCIASDGINFRVYSPVVKDLSKKEVQPEEIQLTLVESIDISTLQPIEVYLWLDRYFLRKKTLPPNTKNIIQDFGINSHAFQIVLAELSSLWKKVKESSEFKVAYENWEKYLSIVYGTPVSEEDKEELFIRHTYLAILAKLMVWKMLGEVSFNTEQIASVLDGEFFKRQGIENFLEEDFFSWVVRKSTKDIGIEIVRKLLSVLDKYNLKELSEDVLKTLYQKLVDPKTRHDLGEFYTPDWLAHRIVRKLIKQNEDGSFLDPACGSGTFLYFVIREKKNKFPDTHETLEHILNSVVGIDVHPLAVIIAKTNYLLALGDLLKKRKGKISIPVYLSDSIRLPEEKPQYTTEVEVPSFKVKLDKEDIFLPDKLLQNPALYDEAIDAVREFAIQNIGKKVLQEHFLSFIQKRHENLIKDINIAKALFHVVETLKDLIEKNRDSIWAFVLKNIYKPLFLKNRFDFVIGNPPWLAFRYAEPDYQKFLKEQITKNYNLLSGRGELITHLELGTLFLLRTADLYLKEGGTIAFVLPRSIFTADQHNELREGKFKKKVNLNFIEVWDCKDVSPLFNVPSCVLIAQKRSEAKVFYPISGQCLSGKLERPNASLDEAEKILSIKNVKLYLHKKGKRSYWGTEEPQKGGEKGSFYRKYFRQGATIVPRSSWFVEIKKSPLGLDPECPPIETSVRAKKEAKKNYKGLVMEGNVERQFLYATLLSVDLLPFGHLDYRLVVLPIEPTHNGYHLINTYQAQKRGFIYLANWLEKVEKEWKKRRGVKAKSMNIYERLDRYRCLSKQNPQAKYRVLYAASGAHVCACVQEDKPINLEINGQSIHINKFIAESKTYYFETSNALEAFYLISILNSSSIDKMIKSMKEGLRDIHKKVLELPIPQFDSSNDIHLRLAELGKLCSQKVTEWLKSEDQGKIKSIGRLRSKVREMLKEELREIDALVQQILR